MSESVRLRQVVVITSDLPRAEAQVQSGLGLSDPYIDPGVAEFGLENRVYAAGDCFVELLTPIRGGTAGGRHLERKGGDAGYMAIFQTDDRGAPRKRAADLGIRVIWQADLDDISGTHLHPADIGAAIVSIDWADPPGSWQWAGPEWTGGVPDHPRGGIRSLTVAAVDPQATAARWAAALGVDAEPDAVMVPLEHGSQELRFVEADDPRGEGIVACGLAVADAEGTVDIAGVEFRVLPP